MDIGTREHLKLLLQEGENVPTSTEVERWSNRVAAFLGAAIGADSANEFKKLFAENIYDQHAVRMGHLEGLLARSQAEASPGPASRAEQIELTQARVSAPAVNSRKVFVVHGHDDAAKNSAARFLDKLGLEPIILHEEASSGRTIIEKFENYSDDVAFAVVLLTPDDVGNAANSSGELLPRARQNVIMELGYFMGRLGRSRVCALYKGGVELPSDYQGVLYIDMDTAGGWKAKLAQEFVQAKIPIDLAGLLGG